MLGSLVNQLCSEVSGGPVPTIGMGATLISWSDRSAYTIVSVTPSGKTFVMQRDEATRTDKNGMSDSQSYTYTPNPKAFLEKVSLRKDGRWKLAGSNQSVLIDCRREYYDYSF